MKVILVHNFYGAAAPSGENRVFELERDMLNRNGHQVVVFDRYSDILRTKGGLGNVAGALMTPWNPAAARQMRHLVAKFSPDIIHAHNTFPMISPSIFPAARGVGRVLTLHNYRLLCPNALPLRDGKICTQCIDQQSVIPAMRYGCYRHSRAATLPLALNVAFNRWRGTWQNDVERFIALTDFQRDVMARGGLPRDRIAVKPNFFPGEPNFIKFEDRPQRVVCVGRISSEKGVGDLVNAWIAWGDAAPELRIIGDGPERVALEQRAAGSPKIHFLGSLSSGDAEYEIASSRLLLLPSRWFEGFPMVMREAFAFGTPIGVSNIGPLPGLVEEADGIVFRAGDPADLKAQVEQRWAEPEHLARMSAASALVFRKLYDEKINYQKLLEIYEQAICDAKENRMERK